MLRVRKYAYGIVSIEKLGNFLDNIKTIILGNLSEQLDTLRIQNKKKYENVALSEFSILGVGKSMIYENVL